MLQLKWNMKYCNILVHLQRFVILTCCYKSLRPMAFVVNSYALELQTVVNELINQDILYFIPEI